MRDTQNGHMSCECVFKYTAIDTQFRHRFWRLSTTSHHTCRMWLFPYQSVDMSCSLRCLSPDNLLIDTRCVMTASTKQSVLTIEKRTSHRNCVRDPTRPSAANCAVNQTTTTTIKRDAHGKSMCGINTRQTQLTSEYEQQQKLRAPLTAPSG